MRLFDFSSTTKNNNSTTHFRIFPFCRSTHLLSYLWCCLWPEEQWGVFAFPRPPVSCARSCSPHLCHHHHHLQWLLTTMECPPTRWSESLLDNTLISKVGVVVRTYCICYLHILKFVSIPLTLSSIWIILCDNIAVEKYSEVDALIVKHQNIRWTYRELADMVDMVAQNLLRMGIKPGDRVGRLTCTASCLDPHHSSCVMSCHVISCDIVSLLHSCWN